MTQDSSSGAASSTSSAEVPVAISSIVHLQVVSPSSQVRSPLSFESLPTTTTVKELKERIRSTLDVSPTPESQRLIYRGRMLARDTETMMEIFGEETLKTSQQQTFHLVLRPPMTEPVQNSNLTPNPLSRESHPPTERTYFQPPWVDPSIPPGPRPGGLPPVQRAVPLPRNDRTPIAPRHPQLQALQAANDLQHQLILQRLQTEHQELTQQLNGFLSQDQRSRMAEQPANGHFPHSLQHPTPQQQQNLPNLTNGQGQYTGNTPGAQQHSLPAFQNLIAQQGNRMQPGPGGPNSNNISEAINQAMRHGPPSRTQSPLPHGHTPDHTTTITRQGINSNGERWQITVNESTTVIPPGSNHPQNPAGTHETNTHMQQLLNSADRLAAMHTRLNNLQRRPGGTPPPGFNAPHAPQRPSSTPPIGRGSTGRSPTMSNNSFPIPTTIPSMTSSFMMPPNDSPMVYIMSSPNGPQALLVHNSQTFYSGNPNIAQQLNGSQLQGLVGEVRNRRERTHRHRHRHRDPNAVQPADGGAAAPAGQAQNVPQRAQPLRIALWPHIWLIIRLLIFVWYFTSGGHNSWSRLFVIWGMSLFLFILNTGVFNEVFGAFWNPIRQHLENLLPLAGPNQAAPARDQPAEGNAAGATPVANGEPNPAEVARRLLEQRRQQDASWVMTQFRRVEHAVLLFIASIVPGTAERHIEARTIEENRLLEQRRQEAAAAAAAMEPTVVENQEGEASGGAQPGAVNGNEQGGNVAVMGAEEGQGAALI